MSISMNGLRVYVNEGITEPSGPTIFYSRRSNGPYYVWHYEATLGQWRFSRMPRTDVAPKPLSLASWKNLPPALQAKLAEHYQE
ncbi:MAG TPA: hypothetical protein VIB00_14565 [Pyrinomonadaceae bacterium]|jgi:hypothetical protein